MRVDFFFDYRSPFAYLANTQIGGLAAEPIFRPIDGFRVMKAVNNQPTPECPPKARYSALDAARWARRYGLAYAPNQALMQAMAAGQLDGAMLLRAALAAEALGMFPAVHASLFDAVWAGSDDLVSEAGRAAFLAARGLPATLWQAASDPAIADRLAAQNKEAAVRGVFGVPTFFVEDEMFFGNDRLSFVAARLSAASVSGDAA